ncbi:MAG: alpha/beta-type small acid-soluble spore protein [Clostridia bacterium]|nr:alpha/beta-type small acid-soluble spore protein [Clostridia bacterium]
MSKRSIMSNQLKEEIAKELGVYESVQKNGGWGDVSSRDCGNMVTKAIEMAERAVSKA